MTPAEPLHIPPELVRVKELALWTEYDDCLSKERLRDGQSRDPDGRIAAFRAHLSSISSLELCWLAADSHNDRKYGVLQDTINEAGRRLGFDVEHGRSYGYLNRPGHDGLWRLPPVGTLVVHIAWETATVPMYPRGPDLEPFVDPRRAMIEARTIGEESSVLLVAVGPGASSYYSKEIRRSRHRRYMSVSSLWPIFGLMLLRDTPDDPPPARWVYHMLRSCESTNVDETLRRMLSPSELSRCQSIRAPNGDLKGVPVEWAPDDGVAAADDRNESAAFYRACISRLASRERAVLLQWCDSRFMTRHGEIAAEVHVSKNYGDTEVGHYWFDEQRSPDESVRLAGRGFVVLVCGAKETVLALPYAVFDGLLSAEHEPWALGSGWHMGSWYLHVVRHEERFWVVREKGELREVTEYVLF